MRKNNPAKRALQDSSQQPPQPDKVGWIRKYCGKGLFREIWKHRYVVLKGDKLYISDKEVKDEKKVQEVVELTDYERAEELRKANSRTKKNHSKFILVCGQQPSNAVPNLVFLALSPEEKESWINTLNIAITRGKNSILDESKPATCTATPLNRRGKDEKDGVCTQIQVTVEEQSCLAHPTRDRAKIPHTRRLPTRGHLMAVASKSTSDGMLTLDLIQEEDSITPKVDRCRFQHDAETIIKSQSLPRKGENSWTCSENQTPSPTPRVGKKLRASEKSRCASMDEILTHSDAKRPIPHCSSSAPTHSISQIQELILLKLERTQELLNEARGHRVNCAPGKEVEHLLEEAACTWGQARDVLEEVKELRVLCKELEEASSSCDKLKSPKQNQYRKSMM